MRVRYFVVAVCLLIIPRLVSATPVTFTINPSLSSLTVTGSIGGGLVTLGPQSAGSNTTSYSGTLTVDEGSGTIQFLSGNAIANLLSAPQQPLPGGAAGSAPADYGFAASGIESGVAAGRGLVAGTTSPVLAVTAGSFPANSTTLTVSAGTVDYNLTGLATEVGSSSVAGNGAVNSSPAGTFATVGNLQTLTLPVSVTVPFTVSGISGTILFAGKVVATATVPEPGTLALAGLGLIGLVPLLRRRLRKA